MNIITIVIIASNADGSDNCRNSNPDGVDDRCSDGGGGDGSGDGEY